MMLKLKLKPVVAGLIALSLISSPAIAASADNDNLQQISQKTELLQEQVKSLQAEIKTLKRQNKQSVSASPAVSQTPARIRYVNEATPTNPLPAQPEIVPSAGKNSEYLENYYATTHATGTADLNQPFVTSDIPKMPLLLYLGGTPVVTSPYIGVRSEFNASDLIVNIPSVNEDLRLLQQWLKLQDEYRKYKQPVPDRPFVELSGKIETQAFYLNAYKGEPNSGVTLSSAEVDVYAQVNPFALAFLAFKYDSSQTTPQTTANSNVFLDKGFVTLGDLKALPLYVTMGQAFVPFGLYSSNMLSAPLTQSIFRTKARYVQLGYAKPNGRDLYAAIYGFNGDSNTDTSTQMNQGGINLGYKGGTECFNYDIGAGVIANIADSDGMQSNGAETGFTGFGATSATELLNHQVPGVDMRANFGFGRYSLLTEYMTATRSFSPENLAFDEHGSRPSAFNIEGSYSFEAFHKPTSFSLGYQQSKQALALLIPERRVIAAINTSIWKSTIASLEYRHDFNYSNSDSASGQNTTVETNNQLGQSSQQLTAQFGVYF